MGNQEVDRSGTRAKALLTQAVRLKYLLILACNYPLATHNKYNTT